MLEDFKKVFEGGCMKFCEYRLFCGYICFFVCYVIDVDYRKVKCWKFC